jgi:hypothetical protein
MKSSHLLLLDLVVGTTRPWWEKRSTLQAIRLDKRRNRFHRIKDQPHRGGEVNNEKALAVFENFKIRRIYDEKLETWYFSVVDIIAALIQQPEYQTARKYWNKLKERLKKEAVSR